MAVVKCQMRLNYKYINYLFIQLKEMFRKDRLAVSQKMRTRNMKNRIIHLEALISQVKCRANFKLKNL